MRDALSYPTPSFVNQRLTKLDAAVAFLHVLTDALNFGNDERNLRPGLQVSDAIFVSAAVALAAFRGMLRSSRSSRLGGPRTLTSQLCLCETLPHVSPCRT